MAKVVNVTFDAIKDTSTLLSSSVRSGFGPSFQQTIVSTSTGRVLITNQSMQILNVLELNSPTATSIMSHIRSHHNSFGNGTKSFVILLNALLKEVFYRTGNISCQPYFHEKSKAVQKVKLGQDIEHILSHTLDYLFKEISQYCLRSDIGQANQESERHIINLVSGTLKSHLSSQDATYLGSLLAKLLESQRKCVTLSTVDTVISHLLMEKNYIFVQNVGHPVSFSTLLPGYLISRGFSRSNSDYLQGFKDIRFVLLSCPLDSTTTDNVAEYSLNSKKRADVVLYHKRLRTSNVLKLITSLEVRIIVTSYHLSTTEKDLCHHCKVTVIHALPEDELQFLSRSFEKEMIYDINNLALGHVGLLSKCNEVTFGTSTYSHLVPVDDSQMRTMLVKAPTEGIASQVKDLVCSSLKVVRSSLVPCAETPFSNCRTKLEGSKISGSGKKPLTCVSQSRTVTAPGDSNPAGSHCTTPEYIFTIPVGGTFELALHHAIGKHLQDLSVTSPGAAMLAILRDSLLCIPQLLHENAYYPSKPRWLDTLTVAKSRMQQGEVVGVDAIEGTAAEHLETESFPSKCQLIVEVLVALRQLLRLQSAL